MQNFFKKIEKSVDKRWTLWYNISCTVKENKLTDTERCPSGLWSWSWKPVISQGTEGSNPSFSANFFIQYVLVSTGEIPKWWRGSPAKGVGSETGARVQIPLSPPETVITCMSYNGFSIYKIYIRILPRAVGNPIRSRLFLSFVIKCCQFT